MLWLHHAECAWREKRKRLTPLNERCIWWVGNQSSLQVPCRQTHIHVSEMLPSLCFCTKYLACKVIRVFYLVWGGVDVVMKPCCSSGIGHVAHVVHQGKTEIGKQS